MDRKSGLEARALSMDTFQAAHINKVLTGFGVRLEPYDIVKKRSTKPKPKPKAKVIVPETYYYEDLDNQDLDDPELGSGGRRSSRVSKPNKKADLGYEEPKKAAKTSGKDFVKRCTGILNDLKSDMYSDSNLAYQVHFLDNIQKDLIAGIHKSAYHFSMAVRKVISDLWN